MGFLSRITSSFWRRDRISTDLADEMSFHLEERTRENILRGMTPAEAEADARRSFGNVSLRHDEVHELHVIVWLDSVIREAGQAWRSLARRPGFVATAVLSLALGIGATSALFSVIDAVLVRPLSAADPASLVSFRETRQGEPIGGNAARLGDWQANATTLRSLSGFYGETATLTGSAEPERVQVLHSFGPLLELLGTVPEVGRTFTAEERAGGGAPVALMSHGLWQRRFGGSPEALNQNLTVDGNGYTVIGILPASFRYPEGNDLLIPAPRAFQTSSRKGGNYFGIIGRLAPGNTLQSAQAEIDGIGRRFAETYPETDGEIRASVIPLQEAETAAAREPLLLLFSAVGLVLLIACVNVASLLLARGAERRHEAAIRVAIGAGRASLLRLYLIESGWLALAGAIGGLILAWFGVPLLVRILPSELPRLAEVTLDWRVVGFTVLIAAVSGLGFGLIPAWRASREAGNEALRAGGRTTPSSNRLLARRTLVVVQVALSMILLVGAALLGRSLYRMRTTPTGLGQTQALAVRLNWSWGAGEERLHEFQRRVLESFSAIPGVRSVGMTDRLPLEGGAQSRPVQLRDATSPGATRLGEKSISYRAVDPGYFQTLNIPVRGGRLWNADRGPQEHPELVVNETFARQYLPTDGAIGSYLTFDTAPEGNQAQVWYEVVGIVNDLRMTLNQPEPVPEIYVPYQDTYWPLLTIVLSASGDPRALTRQVRNAIHAIDPDQIIDGIAPLQDELRLVTAEARTRTGVVGVFALTALLLAAIGLYGVLASDVTQRTQEIGVRLALGADPKQVRWMLVRRGLLLTAAGLGAGLAAAFLLGKVLANLLFGVTATDVIAFVGAAMVLAVVALVACWVPAQRAARLDPVVALRRE